MITKFYRKHISKNCRDKIYKTFLGKYLTIYRDLRERIRCRSYALRFFFISPKTEKEFAMKNISKLGYTPYPYIWKKEYDKIIVGEKIDKDGFPYVFHNNNKLYFKKSMLSIAGNAYKNLRIEQDIRSAHRYVNSYEELKGKILLDIGCAEAIFTLDVIEYVDHAYLFECDENWIAALEKTFEPWKNKITIVRKYVSDIDSEHNIRLDTFFKDRPKDLLFLKMDIEGYESKALNGANNLLQKNNVSGSICIYHRREDEQKLKILLQDRGKKIEVSPGYLYFEKELRHAIIRFN